MASLQRYISYTFAIALILLGSACGKVDEANQHLQAMDRNTSQMNEQIGQMNTQISQLNTQIFQMNSQMTSLNQSLATMSMAISSFVNMSQGLATQFLQMVLSTQNNRSIENDFPNIDDVMNNLDENPGDQTTTQTSQEPTHETTR